MSAGLDRLKAFARRPVEGERCGLCSAVVAEAHAHLWNVDARRVECACAACSLLFASGDGRHRPIEVQSRALPGFVLDDATWDALAVPIGLCFFVRRGDDVVAIYPSPGGATESPIDGATWAKLCADNPGLSLVEHVEALLVRRIDGRRTYHRVSIDRAYALVGLVRKHWRGLGGGPELHEALARYFDRLGGAHA